MADEIAKKDANYRRAAFGVGSSSGDTIVLRLDDTTKRLLVDVAAGSFVGSTQVVDGEAVDAADTGVLVLGTDGSNYQILSVDSSGRLILGASSGVDIGDVDILSLPGSIDGPGAPTIDSYTQVAINLDAGADQVLVSSAANKQIWVYSVAYTCSVAGTVSFQDEDNTAITGIMDHAANSGLAVGASGNFAMPVWKLATNKDLEVDVVSAALDGWISYSLVSV